MTRADVIRLLAIIATFDNRRVEDSTIAAWCSLFDGTPWTFEQARQAVLHHFRTSTDYLLPAHVLRGARIARDEEEREERRQKALLPREKPQGAPKPADFDAIAEKAREEARAARQQGIH